MNKYTFIKPGVEMNPNRLKGGTLRDKRHTYFVGSITQGQGNSHLSTQHSITKYCREDL